MRSLVVAMVALLVIVALYVYRADSVARKDGTSIEHSVCANAECNGDLVVQYFSQGGWLVQLVTEDGEGFLNLTPDEAAKAIDGGWRRIKPGDAQYPKFRNLYDAQSSLKEVNPGYGSPGY